MSLWRRLKSAIRNETESAVLSDYNALSSLFGVPDVGLRRVDAGRAFKVAAVYACARLIAGAIAQLPVRIHTGRDADKRRTRPRLERLLNLQPTPLMTGPQFWEWTVANVLLQGDHYAIIERDEFNRPTGFRPVHKSAMSVQVMRESQRGSTPPQLGTAFAGNPIGGRLVYTCRVEDQLRHYDQDEVLHFSNFGFNGITAPSTIQGGAAGAVGLHVSMEEWSQDFFDNGANQKWALLRAGSWTADDKQAIRERWVETYGHGTKTKNLPVVLDKTADIKALSVSAEDSQLLQSREFEITEIARAFGLPSFMLNQEQKTTSWGQGVAEIGQVFLRHTLMPHIRRLEAEVERKLFLRSGESVRFDAAGLSRATMRERYEAYVMALGGGGGKPGFMSVNEIRAMEDLPAIEGEEYDRPHAASGGSMMDPTMEPMEADNERIDSDDED